jgi:hypothetical protein
MRLIEYVKIFKTINWFTQWVIAIAGYVCILSISESTDSKSRKLDSSFDKRWESKIYLKAQ